MKTKVNKNKAGRRKTKIIKSKRKRLEMKHNLQYFLLRQKTPPVMKNTTAIMVNRLKARSQAWIPYLISMSTIMPIIVIPKIIIKIPAAFLILAPLLKGIVTHRYYTLINCGILGHNTWFVVGLISMVSVELMPFRNKLNWPTKVDMLPSN